jgi:SET family sugar efflux transporter-like MFS transporter
VTAASPTTGGPASASSRRRALQFAAGVWGLQFGLLNPMLALALATLLHANNAQVGIALALYNASGFVGSLVVPTWADRKGNYLTWMFVSGIATFALAGVLLLSGNLIIAIIGMIIVGAPSGLGISMFFAHMRAQGFSKAEILSTRAMFSLTWAGAAPFASLLVDWLGVASVLVAVAIVALSSLATVYLLRRTTPKVQPAVHQNADAAVSFSKSRVTAIMIAFILLMGTLNVVSSAMSLFTVNDLHLPAIWAGVALAIAALGEVPALLVLGRLSNRFGAIPLIISGCIVGAVYYLAMAVVHDPVTLVALQLLRAWFFAAVTGVGLTFFQDIIARPGLASGLFTNTQRIGAVFSGLLIALAGTPAGFSGVFLVSAGLTALAIVITLIAAGRRRPPRLETPSSKAAELSPPPSAESQA